jgi:AP-3 complex subunit delta
MLEKNVAAMVRDIRDGAADAISRNLSEIKMELSSPNPRIKMNAVLKLGYLSMLGYDLSIAQLQIIEMMANPQFVLKRPAMFIAALAFEKNCEENSLVLMTTNLFRKELVSPNYLEVGMALSCLSCVITEDMAESLLSSVLGQVTASRPYVRKKVALSLFKLIEKSPELFIPAFPKLKELVVDGDQSVQSAAVSTFLEIAKRNPKLAIPLIPIFFHLFKETRNNWTLIKMIKLMELLCGVEPRLFGKLIDSKILIHLLDTNKARSVEIEIIRLVTRLIPLETQMESEHYDRVMINLKNLIEASDLNIKCLAIDILVTFLGRHGSSVEMDFFFPVILASLGSTDCTVRQLAMKAIKFLVSVSRCDSAAFDSIHSI